MEQLWWVGAAREEQTAVREGGWARSDQGREDKRGRCLVGKGWVGLGWV